MAPKEQRQEPQPVTFKFKPKNPPESGWEIQWKKLGKVWHDFSSVTDDSVRQHRSDLSLYTQYGLLLRHSTQFISADRPGPGVNFWVSELKSYISAFKIQKHSKKRGDSKVDDGAWVFSGEGARHLAKKIRENIQRYGLEGNSNDQPEDGPDTIHAADVFVGLRFSEMIFEVAPRRYSQRHSADNPLEVTCNWELKEATGQWWRKREALVRLNGHFTDELVHDVALERVLIRKRTFYVVGDDKDYLSRIFRLTPLKGFSNDAESRETAKTATNKILKHMRLAASVLQWSNRIKASLAPLALLAAFAASLISVYDYDGLNDTQKALFVIGVVGAGFGLAGVLLDLTLQAATVYLKGGSKRLMNGDTQGNARRREASAVQQWPSTSWMC